MIAQIRAELLKIRSTRTTVGLLLGMVALILLFALLTGLLSHPTRAREQGEPASTAEHRRPRRHVLGACGRAACDQRVPLRHDPPDDPVQRRVARTYSPPSSSPARLPDSCSGSSARRSAGRSATRSSAGVASRSCSAAATSCSLALGGLAGVALWGAIGVGLGAIIRNQVGAVITLLAWGFVVDSSCSASCPPSAASCRHARRTR